MAAKKPGAPATTDEQWSRVRGQLRAEFGEAAYNSWLQPLSLDSVSDGRVTMHAPTRFMREWVVSRYADRIRALWRGEDPKISAIDIAVSAKGAVAVARDEAPVAPAARTGSDAAKGQAPAVERNFTGALDLRYNFDNFVVGKSNEFAHAAAQRVANADEVPFNPLFIYGGVGLGKTHLMHGIAWEIRRRDPQRRV
ncbi:MAG: DnaA/Hda family protein, partial [Alphaproteobacteria bacterium]